MARDQERMVTMQLGPGLANLHQFPIPQHVDPEVLESLRKVIEAVLMPDETPFLTLRARVEAEKLLVDLRAREDWLYRGR